MGWQNTDSLLGIKRSGCIIQAHTWFKHAVSSGCASSRTTVGSIRSDDGTGEPSSEPERDESVGYVICVILVFYQIMRDEVFQPVPGA